MDSFEPAADDVILKMGHGVQCLYTVYPDAKGVWIVKQVPLKPHSFTGRKPLPEAWAGLRDADLAAVTGVPDATFCHNGRFIAGAKTKEGAVKLARLAVQA
jgi:uncharacterized UPF0160 family protein